MTGQALVFKRTLDAPRKLAWKVRIDPGMMMKFWSPNNLTLPFCQIDFQVGGKYLFCLPALDGL